MTAAIDWSIGLLDSDIAGALGTLTVFAGTFDATASRSVLQEVNGLDAVEVIDELVAQSLLETLRSNAGVRYRVLEPVRQRAAEVLVPEPNRPRQAHLRHYLDRLEQAYATFASSSPDPLLAILDHDLDNLRKVHEWALHEGLIDDDLRLYRPLSLSTLHGIHEPADWALETILSADVDGRRGATLRFGSQFECSSSGTTRQPSSPQSSSGQSGSCHSRRPRSDDRSTRNRAAVSRRIRARDRCLANRGVRRPSRRHQ